MVGIAAPEPNHDEAFPNSARHPDHGGCSRRSRRAASRAPAAAARRAVVQSMLKAGLIEEVAADDAQPAWRTTDAGERFALRVTEAGLRAAGAETPAPEPAQGGPQQGATASA